MSAAGNAQLVLVDENHTRAPMPPLKRKVRRRTDDGLTVIIVMRELSCFVIIVVELLNCIQNYA